MKYDNIITFESALPRVNTSGFSPVYLILVKEDFSRNEAVQSVLNSILPSQQLKELGLTVLEGSQVNLSFLNHLLNSRSFLVNSKVIWIQNVDKIEKSIQEKLQAYLRKPAPFIHLILTASTSTKKSLLYTESEKVGVLLEIAETKSWEKEKHLINWINKYTTLQNKTISYQTSQALVQYLGNDQEIIASELEKLICYLGEKKEISQKDIQHICIQQHIQTIWQLGEALFHRDALQAIEISRALLNNGQAFLPLLRQIRGQFQVGYQICLLLKEDKYLEEIAKEFPYMKGQILKKNLNRSKSYGTESFRKGLIAIDAAESRIKHAAISEQLLAEILILQLTQQPEDNQ